MGLSRRSHSFDRVTVGPQHLQERLSSSLQATAARYTESKGRKDRNVMLSPETFDLLRCWEKSGMGRRDNGLRAMQRGGIGNHAAAVAIAGSYQGRSHVTAEQGDIREWRCAGCSGRWARARRRNKTEMAGTKTFQRHILQGYRVAGIER